MKKVYLATLALAALPFTAFADNCDQPRDDFDNLYCLNKVYIQADKDLNTAYKALRGYLNSSEKKTLKTGQIEWINHRNDDCSDYNDRGFFVNLRCAADTTIDRTNFLQDRIRECKATGCQPSKL
ncbi:MAG TPA: DUF1311 domain-containing protein [Thiothrix sp.]|nr:DUF1311 domain-containing protein [Thiothrix sp.]